MYVTILPKEFCPFYKSKPRPAEVGLVLKGEQVELVLRPQVGAKNLACNLSPRP